MFIMEQMGLKFEQEYGVDGAELTLEVPEKEVETIVPRFNPFPDIRIITE
jgi:hypothetical protein